MANQVMLLINRGIRMNKRAQDFRMIGGAILFIFALFVLLPQLSHVISDASCQNEKKQVQDLQNQLNTCQGAQQQVGQSLKNCQDQLSKLTKENEELLSNLTKVQGDLENCQKSKTYTYFPLFGITKINLTTGWIVVLNISLGLSLVSIFNILSWLFKSKKK